MLLHGVGQTCHTWDLFAAAMSEHFHVMAFDQRGHGDTDWARDKDYSRASMVKDAKAFTDELGLDRFFLTGMSMGGANSLAFTANYPDKVEALVVVDVGPRVEPKGVKHIRDFMKNYREFDSLDKAAAVIHKFNPRRSLEIIRKYTVVYNLKQLPSGKWTWKYDKALRRPGANRRGTPDETKQLWRLLESIQCPTLVVRGSGSDTISNEVAAEMAERIPNGRLAVVPESGHLVPGDNPIGFLEVLNGFLAKVG